MTDWVLQTFLATTLLMAIFVLLNGRLARSLGAKWAYGLWALVALRLVMPPLAIDWRPAFFQPETVMVAGPGAMPAAPGFLEVHGASLVAAWLVIAAVIFLSGLASSLLFQFRLARSATPIARLGRIDILVSPLAEGPVATGLFHRRITLPHDHASRWSEAEAAMIIAHERVHHERGDLWANLLGYFILSLHWFNPVAWAAWKRFRIDQECSCDAAVLAARSDDERALYGQALLKASGRETLPALSLALITPKTIVERIEMMTNKDHKRARPAFVALGATALLAVPASAATFVQDEGEPQKGTLQRVILFKSEDGKTQTFTVKGDTKVEHEGTSVQVHAIGPEDLDGVKNVWVTNTGGEKFQVVIKPCKDGEDCTIEVKGD